MPRLPSISPIQRTSQRTVFRTRRSLVLAAANLVAYTGAALTMACSDAPTAPSPAAPPMADVARRAPAPDTATATFVYDPSTPQTQDIGALRVTFPGDALCAPRSAPSDDACTVLTTRVTISARAWIADDGRPHVRLAPALRLAPGAVVTAEAPAAGRTMVYTVGAAGGRHRSGYNVVVD